MAMNDVGKPCARKPHARFERGPLAKRNAHGEMEHAPDEKSSGLSPSTYRRTTSQRPTSQLGIPDDGNYLCFRARHYRLLNLPQISIDTIPQRADTNAICPDTELTDRLHAVDQEVPQLAGLVAAPPESGSGDSEAATLYRDGIFAGTAVFIYGAAAANLNLLDWSIDNRAACENAGLWDALNNAAQDFGCTNTTEHIGTCPSALLSTFDSTAPPGWVRANCTS